MVSPRQHAPILSTKLYRPLVTSDYLPREALRARLDAGREMPLTVVSAPPGYGKSTLPPRNSPRMRRSTRQSEDEIGGKLADFVVIDADPRKVDPPQIGEIKVLQTWIDGKRAF